MTSTSKTTTTSKTTDHAPSSPTVSNQSNKTNTGLKKPYSVGIDLGTNKITVSRCDLMKPSVYSEVLADMMDIRNIPNLVQFPTENDQTREFGNSVSDHKAFQSMNYAPGLENDMTSNHVIHFNGEDHNLPQYVIKGMILGHVKKIIDHRCSELLDEKYNYDQGFKPDQEFDSKQELDSNRKFKKPKQSIIVIVPSSSSSSKNIFFECMGADLNLRASTVDQEHVITVKSISSVNALIFGYLERYVFSLDSAIDIAPRSVLIADLGQVRSMIFMFTLSRKQGSVFIELMDYMSPSKLCGNHIDDLFVEHMAQRVREKFPRFRLTKTCDNRYQDLRIFRTAVMKLKHQLSTNQVVSFALQGIEQDISFPVERKEFETLIHSNELDIFLKSALLYFKEVWNKLPVTHVEMVGGCSRIPYFRDVMKQVFPIPIGSLNVDEAVANGAALYGWILRHKEVAKTVQFTRIARKRLAVRYLKDKSTGSKNTITKTDVLNSDESHYNEIPICERMDRLITTFGKTDANKSSDTKSDLTVVRISRVKQFQIIHDDLRLQVIIKSPLKNTKYLDIKLRYSMSDDVEISEVLNSTGNNMYFDVMIQQSGTPYESYGSLIQKYVKLERNFATIEKLIERRYNFTNFMESYYLNKDMVNELISSINSKDIKKENDTTIIINNVDEIPARDLSYPLKEVYEFYQFCKTYCSAEDLMDDHMLSRKRHIEKILGDEISLAQMEKGVEIIKIIQSKY